MTARFLTGSVLLPVLLLLSLVSCGVEAEQFDEGTVKRAGDYEVSMNVDPNPPSAGGTAEMTFEVRKNGHPLEEAKPRLVTDMPKMPMNTPAVPLESDGPGRWKANVKFPMAGGWAATMTLPSGGDEVSFEFDVAP